MAADAGEGPRPKAAGAVEDAGGAPLVSIGEADCGAVSASGEPGAPLLPPMPDPGDGAPVVCVTCATEEKEDAAHGVAMVGARAPAAMPKRGPWADLLDNAEEDTVVDAFARGELLGLTTAQEQRFSDHVMNLLSRETTRPAAAVEATEEEAAEDIGWDDPACLAAQARRAAAVEVEAAKPRRCTYAGNEYMTGCTQHGVQQVTFAKKSEKRSGGTTNGPDGQGHWLCDTCAEYCYGQKPAIARPWRPADWAMAQNTKCARPGHGDRTSWAPEPPAEEAAAVEKGPSLHEAHVAARAEQAREAAVERARAAAAEAAEAKEAAARAEAQRVAANKAAEEKAAAACEAAERAAKTAAENRRTVGAVGAVLSGQATWDTGAACGVFSSGFGAGPKAEEKPSRITLTHAGGGEIDTEGKVRAVPVHTGDLISAKTGVVGAVTKDLISAYDDVGAETSPFVAVLDGPRAVLLPKEHHAEVLGKLRALVAAAVETGPTAPLVWKDRTMRLGPARGDPRTALWIQNTADIGGVEKTVVPAVTAAVEAPAPAAAPGKQTAAEDAAAIEQAWADEGERLEKLHSAVLAGPTPAESAAQKTAAEAARKPAPKLAPAPKAAAAPVAKAAAAPAAKAPAAPATKPGYAEAQVKALRAVGSWRPMLRWPIAAVHSAAATLGVSPNQDKPALCKELWSRVSGGRGAARRSA